MRITVDEVQSRIASLADLDESTSQISSTDYSLRLKYLNIALLEWAEVSDWQVLFKEYNMNVSTSTGNASIVLPTDFRKLASFPKITYDGTNTAKYPEVLPQDDGQYNATDKRVWILGTPSSRYILRVFGTTLSSGASVKVPYYSSPGSLATSSDVADIPNPDFLVKRALSLLWESREDPRFPQVKADAEKILRNMLEQENVFNKASDYKSVKTVEQTSYDFRWGRD